ncbi:hypothetical protein I5E68_06025 [Novosphingobium sp. YJ-S2-02]|uniref:Uncharacterized protein n=1 Tax=Novosphingobium aureum TaxID=2792964 RepID=A0A931MK75_9SPHN|nr:hypothetical protein [Novosphingobium aureum]MBH0112508.1 hypothetical protein [Novosphingobium aureum]
MSTRDPAMVRFFALHVTRLLGIASLIAGLMIVENTLLPGLPDWAGYLLIINGVVDIFIVPQVLARRWRSPPPAPTTPDQD